LGETSLQQFRDEEQQSKASVDYHEGDSDPNQGKGSRLLHGRNGNPDRAVQIAESALDQVLRNQSRQNSYGENHDQEMKADDSDHNSISHKSRQS
jgi:hypothetical protein